MCVCVRAFENVCIHLNMFVCSYMNSNLCNQVFMPFLWPVHTILGQTGCTEG